ncbi:hypothetical protein D3C87_1636620 [compost metagenome]
MLLAGSGWGEGRARLPRLHPARHPHGLAFDSRVPSDSSVSRSPRGTATCRWRLPRGGGPTSCKRVGRSPGLLRSRGEVYPLPGATGRSEAPSHRMSALRGGSTPQKHQSPPSFRSAGVAALDPAQPSLRPRARGAGCRHTHRSSLASISTYVSGTYRVPTEIRLQPFQACCRLRGTLNGVRPCSLLEKRDQ